MAERVLIGICSTFSGFVILLFPEPYFSERYGYTISFEGVNWIIGPLLIFIGLYQFREPKHEKADYVNRICPSCKKPYQLKIEKVTKCSKCDVDLVTLEEILESKKDN